MWFGICRVQQNFKSKSFLWEFYEGCESDPENMLTQNGKYPYVVMVVLYHSKTP
jgi:hypothetical protein